MELTHISLFTGIGGIDLAAEWAGFKTILMVENNAYCQKVLNKHWPNVPLRGDIRDVKGSELTATIITGGFPCQPVSQAGQRKGEEDDRWLWPDMLRVISEVWPPWVVAENVTGLLSLGFYDCLSDLEGQGYETVTFVIPACAVNAPHRRDRIFIVANTSVERLEGAKPERATQACGCSPQHSNVFNSEGERRESGGCEFNQADGWCWWATEPDVGRVAYGIPSRVDRLKALGNAVVPQQIYPILKAIADIELRLAKEVNC